MLPEGESQAPNHRPTPSALYRANTIEPLPYEVARDAFYHDCPEDLAREAAAHLRVVPASAKGAASTVPAAWRTIPSTYVVCTDDHMLPTDDQRDMAAQAGEVFEIFSSHSPFFSHPAEVAEIIRAYS
jgi:pimeloyl-ACP methyl ester carboxylesterase